MSNFGRRADRDNIEFIRLNSKAITFERREKVNGTYVVAESFNKVTGYLTGAKLDQYEYKGEVKRKLILELEDGDGNKALVDINFNSVCISLINSLAVPQLDGQPAAVKKLVKNADKESPFGKEISISVYPREYEGEKYCAASIWMDDEMLDWAFNADTMGMLRKDLQKTGGEALVRFFDAHVKPLSDKYNLKRPKNDDADNYFPPAEAEPKEPEMADEAGSDLPF